MTPRVSVILALGGEGEEPNRCLAALAAQDPGTAPFDVVMAGSGAASYEGQRRRPGLEPLIVETKSGPVGAAWNAGASVATGEILLFIRADAIPDPGLVALHLASHTDAAPVVVVGPVAVTEQTSRPPSVAECEGQTLSLRREAFHRAGGFDATLGWGAEIELAYRLTTGGMALRRTAAVVGHRAGPAGGRDSTDARSAAGRGSVELYRHTPALLPFLELGAFQSAGPSALRLRRVLLALGGPRLPNLPGALLSRGEWRDRWHRFTHDYHFWRGAMGAVRDRAMRRALVRAPVILMYHAVGRPGEAPGWYIVPVRRFARHMAWLAARRYRVLSLAELLEYRRRFELPPARSVVITFDDGYADNYELAYPMLRARGFRATFFLVSGRIGGRNDWDTRSELSGRPILSWQAARALVVGGMEIGAHTRRHPVLPELPRAEVADEVGGSRRDLESGLGHPVSTFAYPFGRLDETTTAAVAEAGFAGACCSRSGVNDPGVAELLLRRVEIRGTDSLLHFALAVHRGRAVRRRRPE